MEGGILLFTVFDHDIITANDFSGMCVLPLHRIPGCRHPPGATASSAPLEPNHTLPIFFFTEETRCRPLTELGQRLAKGDSDASNFFKVNKKILGNLKKLVKDGSKTSLFAM